MPKACAAIRTASSMSRENCFALASCRSRPPRKSHTPADHTSSWQSTSTRGPDGMTPPKIPTRSRSGGERNHSSMCLKKSPALRALKLVLGNGTGA
jgi:hypothetical protein